MSAADTGAAIARAANAMPESSSVFFMDELHLVFELVHFPRAISCACGDKSATPPKKNTVLGRTRVSVENFFKVPSRHERNMAPMCLLLLLSIMRAAVR